MEPKISLKGLAKGIKFLHGISGGGKGEVEKILRKYCEDKHIKYFYGSSGDFYRAMLKANAKDLSPEMVIIQETMRSGKPIDSLEPIIVPLENLFKEYFMAVLNDEPAILVLDGFLRRGEFVGQEGGLYQGQHIPTQIDQVSEAAMRSFKSVLKADYRLAVKLAKANPELFVQLMARDDVKYINVDKDRLPGGFTREMIVNANHVVIQIPPNDAEVLMRFRFYKEIVSLKKNLKVLNIDTDDFRLFKGYVNEILTLLNNDEPPSIEFNFNAPMSSVKGKMVDSELKRIAQNIIGLEDVKLAKQIKDDSEIDVKLTTKSAFEAYFRARGISVPIGGIRDDDEMYASRMSRVGMFDGIREEVIEAELGVKYEGYRVVDGSLRPNVIKLENGPSLGIEYPDLIHNAEGVVQRLVEPINVKSEFENLRVGRRVER